MSLQRAKGSRLNKLISHRDGDLFFIGKFLQFFLPQSIPYPIGTTAISCDQKLALFWIERFSPLLPPPSDALDSKLSGIMINAHIDKPTIVNQIVDSIGDRFPISQGKKVIDVHFSGFSFGLPFCSIILEIANQLLFRYCSGSARRRCCTRSAGPMLIAATAGSSSAGPSQPASNNSSSEFAGRR
jgi:hypothetical protein